MSVSLHARPPEVLTTLARNIRRTILTMAYRSKSGHIGSAFSVTDILLALYFGFLRYDSLSPKDPTRDRLILSKGHACSALYAVLAEAGFFPTETLETYLQNGSPLPGHPSTVLPGVECSSGSLGHGLGIGTGIALAAMRDGAPYRTVVVMSDGECDEGAVWEAALAAAQWKLSSLLCVIDCNGLQAFGKTADVLDLEPFADKWRSFGWRVFDVDGHDHFALLTVLYQAAVPDGRPTVIIARTVKGKGVSFMEGTIDWHYWSPSDAHFREAIQELSDAPISSVTT